MQKHKHKNAIHGIELRRSLLVFGFYGIKAKESGEFTLNQYNLIKKLLTKCFNKQIKVWFRISFDTPKTARPLGARMGSGKSPILYNVAKIYKGQILFEWSFVSKEANSSFIKALIPKLNIASVCISKGL